MEKILIIDDSVTQADFLRSILKESYEITVANTGEEGLQRSKEEDFSLILLDVVMPGMDGFALLKKLQEEVVTRSIPVILITSLADVQHEEQGLTLGAVDYITKPFHVPVVKARVNTHVKLHRYHVQMERQAMVDQLTGVANRCQYDACRLEKWQDAARLKVPISLCMMDIDHFKLYNDTFGHPAGDKVISAVANTVTGLLRRNTDFFARYGGEEFVAILLGNDAESAFRHLTRIRQAVENQHIPHSPAAGTWVTISVGGVTVVPKGEDSFDTYLKIADTMLYDAKRFGRNQVVWSDGRVEQIKENKP